MNTINLSFLGQKVFNISPVGFKWQSIRLHLNIKDRGHSSKVMRQRIYLPLRCIYLHLWCIYRRDSSSGHLQGIGRETSLLIYVTAASDLEAELFSLNTMRHRSFDPIAQLITCSISCRTAFKWCEFDPRDVQQLFGTPFSKVSLWQLICKKSFQQLI